MIQQQEPLEAEILNTQGILFFEYRRYCLLLKRFTTSIIRYHVVIIQKQLLTQTNDNTMHHKPKLDLLLYLKNLRRGIFSIN